MINSKTHGGLGNRLKNIVSCMKLSDEYNLQINIQWEKKPFVCNCNFNDLYENDFSINNLSNIKINYPFNPFACWRLYVSNKDNIPNNFTKIKKNFIGDKLSGNINYTRFIDLEYNRITDSLKNQYINYFNSLKLKKEIKEKIDSFTNKNFNDKTISVHFRGVRIGDCKNWQKKETHKKFIEQWKEKYINEMKKYSSDYNFYFTCINKEIIDFFKNIFKNRIITYEKSFFLKEENKDNIGYYQDDLVELYLLSKNNIIIGSHSSTYTEVAWYLGGCTKNIIIIK